MAAESAGGILYPISTTSSAEARARVARLQRKAQKDSRSRPKKAAVEAGLRLLVQLRAQTGIRKLRGKIQWNGNLEKSRQGRIAK